MEKARVGSKEQVYITQVRDGIIKKLPRRDDVVSEEPLEIRIQTPDYTKTLAVTMRTPSADFELATGFLFSEGIIRSADDIHEISYCVDSDLSEEQRYNVVNVRLRQTPQRELKHLERHFTMSSACGVCGKSSIEAIEVAGLQAIPEIFTISPEKIASLSAKLRAEQAMFDTTGGLHAVGLFDKEGNLLATREDVGRHNAMDKLIGSAVLSQQTPLNEHIVLVSGRASFELVQKVAVAQIPIFCAISAPSNLAIATAQRFGITLIGFLRGNNFNIYSHAGRIA